MMYRDFSAMTIIVVTSIAVAALTGCGSSNGTELVIASAPAPAPVISTIAPSSTVAGGATFMLTIRGANFLTTSVVNFNGGALLTTFTSATQLTAVVPASAIASAGTAGVSVTNPAPGGISNVANFTIAPPPAPPPMITTIVPNSAVAGGATFTLTINGANFLAASTVNFNGAPLVTTFVSATQLTAPVPASAIVSTGTVVVSVTNPAPGGTSNLADFIITVGFNPAPIISSLSPSGAPASGPAFHLWIYGSNFVPGSVVRWNGSDRQTTVVDASTVTAQIPATDIAAAGSVAITVFNPAPAGGSSDTVNFPIIAAGISPRSIAVDPTGKFAYVANFSFAEVFVGDVSMFSIDANTGLLTPIGPRVPAEHGPAAVIVHPSGKFAYVANSGDQGGGEDVGAVSIYNVDATTGALTPAGTVRGGCPQLCAPHSVAIDPAGKFAYVPSEAGPAPTAISIYAIDPLNGSLTKTGEASAWERAFSAVVRPSGGFLYVVDGSIGNTISWYTMDSISGGISRNGSMADNGAHDRSIAFAPSGKFAYTTNPELNSVSQYRVDVTVGTPSLLELSTAGMFPVAAAVDPLEKFAYVANADSNDVAMYTIDDTTGALTFTGTIPAGTSPSAITIHPSGKFVYVTNSGSNDVSIYSIDAQTGALTRIGTIGT